MTQPAPPRCVLNVLRGVNDVHEYEHELLETYSQSSGSLSYDSYQAMDKDVAKQYRIVASVGTPFANLACRFADERLCEKDVVKPQIVPVSAAALHELNRRHVRKPLHRVEQRMHVMIPANDGAFGSQNPNSDLLELYDKTISHYTSSPMMNHKAFRLEVVCTPRNIRPSHFRLDLIALNKTKAAAETLPGAYKSKESSFHSVETIHQHEMSAVRNPQEEEKALRRQKRKEKERIRQESKKLRGSRSKYPENTAFGGMTIDKHVAKVTRSKSTPKAPLKAGSK